MNLTIKEQEKIYLDDRIIGDRVCQFECYSDYIFTYYAEMNNGFSLEVSIIPTDKCEQMMFTEELDILLGMEFDFMQVRIFKDFMSDGEILLMKRKEK